MIDDLIQPQKRKRGRRLPALSLSLKPLVFGAVMADAALLDAVLELDVWGKERVEGGRRG